jgi:hypothetical protein
MRRFFLLVGFMTVMVPCVAADNKDLPPLNAAVLKYCESKEGKRVGSGECSHLANEALRVAGAEFTQVAADGQRVPDSPGAGDYVWGTKVKTYSFDPMSKKVLDSDPKMKCLPGDILQFRDVKTSNGFIFPHHTAIVRTVDEAGNPTGIYQQNIQTPKGTDGRFVQKSQLQTMKMISGRIMVYRPEKATNPLPMQFTLTNNSKSKSVEFVFCGKKAKIDGPNAADGFSIIWASKGADTLTVDGTTYKIASRKGYEFFTTAEGKIALAEVK